MFEQVTRRDRTSPVLGKLAVENKENLFTLNNFKDLSEDKWKELGVTGDITRIHDSQNDGDTWKNGRSANSKK